MKKDKIVHELGSKLITCSENCKGICNKLKEGLIPRGLILEPGDKRGIPIIIVGLNPGRSQDKEQEAYKNNYTYMGVRDYWETKFKGHIFHFRLRAIAKQLGYKGDILWTELVKCEKGKKQKIPIQTFRTCVNKHLIKEIKETNPFKDWTIMAAGNTVFDYISLLFPERTIIGVPHPSGSSRKINRWLDKDKETGKRLELKKRYLKRYKKEIKEGEAIFPDIK